MLKRSVGQFGLTWSLGRPTSQGRRARAARRQPNPFRRSGLESLEPRALLAAAPVVDFIAGGSSGEHAYGVAADSADNLYLAGLFAGTTDLDPGPGVFPLASNGDADIYVAKYDASRTVVWARQFGGAGFDQAYKAAVDRDGNTYVIAQVNGAVTFDSFTVTASGNTGVVMRLDPTGAVTWVTPLTAGALASYVQMVVDDRAANPVDHSVYLATFEGGLSRLSAAAGAAQWAKTSGVIYGGLALDGTGAGALVLSGRFTNKVTLGSTTLKTGKNDWNSFVAKTDLAGNFQWAKAVAVDGSNYAEGGVVTVADGDIYVSGRFKGQTKIGGTTLKSLAGAGYRDNRYIAKLNASGSVQWAQGILEATPYHIQSIWAMTISGIAVTGEGSVFLAGTFEDEWRLGGDVLTSILYDTVEGYGSPDGFVSELNASTGQFIESWRFGGESWDLANGLAADGNGNVFVAGYVNRINNGGTADFPDGTIHTSTSTDIVVLRLEPAPAAALAVAAQSLTQQTAVGPATLDGLSVDAVMRGFGRPARRAFFRPLILR
jgi:hypothetical protein